MMAYRSAPPTPSIPLHEMFGLRSAAQVGADLRHVLGRMGRAFQVDLSSLGHLRPDLALPAYARRIRADGLAPIMNLFDRVGGGERFSQRVTKKRARDYRGGRLTYDEHDGVDFVCPVGTPVVAAAPGIVTLVRDRWLRGGLTMTLDHGGAVSTQYTHLSRVLATPGTRVRRGEVIALSGASGMDLTLFFPWVPPHVHFMVWHRGRPVDPFLKDDESRETAVWSQRNEPLPASTRNEPLIEPLVDEALASAVAERCTDAAILREIARARHDRLALVALLEDSLHHDRFAWPEDLSAQEIRRGDTPIAITLPLDPESYRGAFPADPD